MRSKHLAATIAALAGTLALSPAMAQGMVNGQGRGFVSPAPVEGAQVRRVAAQQNGHLAYEYQSGAGISRVSVDPTSLVGDIERARKRAPQKRANRSSTSAAAPAIPLKEPEIAQADLPGPAAEIASVPREERKVRVIPLYRLPNAD